MTSAATPTNFFTALPACRTPGDTFLPGVFAPAPGDWQVVVTDVRNSTGAIARGLHRTVNFIAAAAIAAIKNLSAPDTIPFLFAGDGVVVLVPPDRAAAAAVSLARLRSFAAREFGLDLRVGMTTVDQLRRAGSDVSVARFEPTPGNSFGVFAGGGVGLAERAMKGPPDAALAKALVIPASTDDGEPIDIGGLSCRWDALRSTRGRMASVIVSSDGDLGPIYARILAIASRGGDPHSVKAENLSPRWPPKDFMLEAKARRRSGPVWLVAASILLTTALSAIVIRNKMRVGKFESERYVQEIVSNTDFSRHDDTFALVLDCSPEVIVDLRAELEAAQARGELRYGLHLSDTALMTCLVTSLDDSLHVHFIDGGEGGYTAASRGLKAAAA